MRKWLCPFKHFALFPPILGTSSSHPASLFFPFSRQRQNLPFSLLDPFSHAFFRRAVEQSWNFETLLLLERDLSSPPNGPRIPFSPGRDWHLPLSTFFLRALWVVSDWPPLLLLLPKPPRFRPFFQVRTSLSQYFSLISPRNIFLQHPCFYSGLVDVPSVFFLKKLRPSLQLK